MINENFIDFIINLKSKAVPKSIKILDPYSDDEGNNAVSYTHLTLPPNREV